MRRQLRAARRGGLLLLAAAAAAEERPAGAASALRRLQGYAAPAASQAAPTVATLEIFYGTHCPNCLLELQLGLQPLMSAGLPGSQVHVALIPWTTGHFGPDGLYVPTPEDVPAFSHICALRSAGFPQPSPIDSPAFIKAANFILCDLDHMINPHLVRNEATAKACALQQGFAWEGADGIKTCTDGGPSSQGYGLMHGAAYSMKITGTQRRPGPPASTTPFVYLDEQMLDCPGPSDCTSVWTPSGMQPLPSPGSLDKVICSRLAPAPAACQGLVAPAPPATASATFNKHCENCVEVGLFRWRDAETSHRPGLFLISSVVGVMLCIGIAVVSRRHACKADAAAADRNPLCRPGGVDQAAWQVELAAD